MMMLRHFRYLSAVVDNGSFTQAARSLSVSQPALSQQIRQLEDSLGVQLLDRTGRRVSPTDAGTAFLLHARRALREAEIAGKAARDVEDLSSGSLRIGLTPSFSAYFIAPVVRCFRERHPGIDLHLIDMSQREIEFALADDQLDLGLAFSEVRSEGIEWRPLHLERLTLAAAYDDTVMSASLIDRLELGRYELALLGPAFATRRTVDDHFRQHGIRARIAIEASSISTIVEIVRNSRLLTVLPDALVREVGGLSTRRLEPPFPSRTAAYLRRQDGYRSHASLALVAILERCAAEFGGTERGAP